MIDLAAPWDSHVLAVVDFETTSIDADTCGPVSVAAVRFEAGEETDSFYGLCNPGMPIPVEASAIHGITDERVKSALPLSAHVEWLAKVCRGAVPVAYHASYDRRILHRHVSDSTVPAFNHGQIWIDPLVIVRDADKWERGTGRHRLENVCNRRGVPLDGAHNALSDARATGLLLLQLLASGAVKSCSLGKLLAHIVKRGEEQEAEFQAWLARQPKREAVSA